MSDHFIAVRKTDLVRRFLEQHPDKAELRDLTAILQALIHVEFHGRLERLKDLYAPIDPNADTIRLGEAATDTAKQQSEFVAELGSLLERANYDQLGNDDFNRALNEESVFSVRLFTQLSDFEKLVLYRRGRRVNPESGRRWFGLRRWQQNVEYYERVVIYAQFKEAGYFPEKRRAKLAFKPGSTALKLFQNIPSADLEMLLPNVEVRMRRTDQVLLGIPAIAGGVVVIATKLGASLFLVGALVAFWLGLHEKHPEVNAEFLVPLGLGLFALTIHFFRQLSTFKNRKIKFMKALSDNLYYKNLDNNAGVFHRLVDDAEEEEFKEVFLAYLILHDSTRSMDREELDVEVEKRLRKEFGILTDFEIGDALDKLERFGLIAKTGDRFSAIPVAQAKASLDSRWDDLFRFTQNS
jgi:hypothetical protein